MDRDLSILLAVKQLENMARHTELLLKAAKDTSRLVKKVIVNKKGVHQTVYVRPDAEAPAAAQKRVVVAPEAWQHHRNYLNVDKLYSIVSGTGYKQDGFVPLTDIVTDALLGKLRIPRESIADVYCYKLPLKETTGKIATFRVLNDIEKGMVEDVLNVPLPSKRLIELSSKATPATMYHELAHVLRSNLKRNFNPENIPVFENSADRLMSHLSVREDTAVSVDTQEGAADLGVAAASGDKVVEVSEQQSEAPQPLHKEPVDNPDVPLTPEAKKLRARLIGTTRNLKYQSEWRRNNRLTLLGQQVQTPHDLAYLSSIYRNPQVENFHIIFVDADNRVVAQTALSSRLPNTAAAFIDINDVQTTMKHCQKIMQQSGATGYYLLHNHPSGNPTPSENDAMVTARYDMLLPGLKGHVVIDHNKYSVLTTIHDPSRPDETGISYSGVQQIPPERQVSSEDKYFKENMSAPFGVTIQNPQDLVNMEHAYIRHRKDFCVLVGVSSGRVSAMVRVPKAYFEGAGLEAQATIAKYARRVGVAGDAMFVVGIDHDPKYATAFQELRRKGFVRDIITTEERSNGDVIEHSAATENLFGRHDPQYALGEYFPMPDEAVASFERVHRPRVRTALSPKAQVLQRAYRKLSLRDLLKAHREGLVPVKVSVQREGKSYITTVWKKSGDAVSAPRRATAKEIEIIPPKEGQWIDRVAHLPEETYTVYFKDGSPVPERAALHAAIMSKYLDAVTPVDTTKSKPVAIMMMGGPASGKSSMIKNMGIDTNAFVNADADAIKAELPEYREAVMAKARNAAMMAHEESSYVVKQIRRRAIDSNKNIIIDGTGGNLSTYLNNLEELKKRGYHVRLMLADLTSTHAIPRAQARAEKTGRLVPPDFIEQTYAKIPSNFLKFKDLVDEFCVFDSRVRPPRLVWSKQNGKETVHDPVWHAQFLKNSELPAHLHKANTLPPARGKERPPAVSFARNIALLLQAYKRNEEAYDKLPKRFDGKDGIREVIYELDDMPAPVRKARVIIRNYYRR